MAAPHARSAPVDLEAGPELGATVATGAEPRRGRALGDRLPITADLPFGLVLTAGLGAIAFITSGGVALGANTWTEIVLTLLGAALAIAVLFAGAPGRRHGLLTLGLFAAFAAFTAASVLWSVQPENSWMEAGRTVSYLAAFGAALGLARLMPGRWPGLVGAIAIVSTLIAGYALLVKVFPATFDPADTLGRLRAPFDYFNATGLIGALGLPACLWAGARHERGRASRGLAVPAVAILATVTILSYSRGALLAAVIGVAVWFAVVPLRLRGALVLGLGLLGAAALSYDGIHTHALTHDLASLRARTDAGHGFGVLLVLVVLVLGAAGLAAAYANDRVRLAAVTRRRIGRVLVIAVALVPAAGMVGLAASPRGLTGEVSHAFAQLTNANSGAANTPGRLVELGNARGRYWREGVTVGRHNLLHGAGAFGYATAVTRYTSDPLTVPHAHSFVVQTFADLGLAGLALSLALLIGWAVAVRRTLARSGGDAPELAAARELAAELGAERAGLLTLLCVVIAFGVHSAIDWTWFIPGTALPALVCAGWLAGRGPLAQPVGRGSERRRLGDHPGAGAGALAIAAAALLCGWAIWQPLRSSDAQAAASAALEHGNPAAALGHARTAADVDPVAIEPLLQLSAIYTGLGEPAQARQQLLRAVARQPENTDTWLSLGEFDLARHRPRRALRSLGRALALDRSSAEASAALARARQAVAR